MSRFPIPNACNAGVIAAQLAAFAAIVWQASVAESWPHVALLACAFAVLGNSIYAIIHEAEHGLLFRHRRANDAAGVAMALLFPAPFHLIRQGHLGHHLRNRSDDEAFDLYFDGESPVWKWLQLYGILTGVFWIVVAFSNVVVLFAPRMLKRWHFEFDRPSAALMDSLNPRRWTIIRLEATAAVALHASIIWFAGVPPLYYAAVYLGFGVSWSAMQYVHHFGTERHTIDGTRNLWLLAPIDWMWLHHNWHHTHHQHPTVPWIYLPRLARAEGARREFLLKHYVRMWRGPRYTNHRVENRYAGRIIR